MRVSRRALVQAQQHAQECQDAGACVLHGVDATALLPVQARGPFTTIVFNFPHTGSQRAHENRTMLQDFFGSSGYALSQHICKSAQLHTQLTSFRLLSHCLVRTMRKRASCRAQSSLFCTHCTTVCSNCLARA